MTLALAEQRQQNQSAADYADERSAVEPQPKATTKARSETQRNRVSRGIGRTKAKPKATPEEKPEGKKDQENLSRLETNLILSNADGNPCPFVPDPTNRELGHFR